MSRTSPIAVCLAGAIVVSASCRPANAWEDYSFYHENVLGTSLELCVRAISPDAARSAENRVLGEIDRLGAIFSGYDPASEFCRWLAAPRNPVQVSAELCEVLRAAEYWRLRSTGAFDIRVEAMSRLWSQCARLGRLPTALETDSAKALMKAPAYQLLATVNMVQRLSDCPLSLNGIAKGYIVERACAAALDKSAGVSGLVLNLGGDLRVCGDIPRTIGIASALVDSESSEPFVSIQVRDRSVATSGNSQRGFRINGKWYSHVFDPTSGLPVERILSATVVAPRGVDADALAKVCSVLDPTETLKLIDSLPGVECLIQESDGAVRRSPGWPGLERPGLLAFASENVQDAVPLRASNAASVSAKGDELAGPAWNKEFELVVNFEINQPATQSGRYRRPYVAVWVEDPKGWPVRTLALWVSMGGAGPFQWLPDLKRWYTSDQERKRAEKKDLFFTISRPTRPPGKYKLIWDGKDNNGKQLAGGDYTITVEAAREHGTYQSIRKQVSLADKAFLEDLKGNVEIRSASIEYRRKAAAK
jgi:thiamine biosynthesis lipoprotein ApbE